MTICVRMLHAVYSSILVNQEKCSLTIGVRQANNTAQMLCMLNQSSNEIEEREHEREREYVVVHVVILYECCVAVCEYYTY